MTDEHVWGRWLKPYLRNTPNKFQTHNAMLARAGPDKKWIDLRAGILLQSSVPVVCKDCNNRWLSEIQSRARHTVPQLIEGKPVVLNEEMQRNIASWAAMSTMTGEFISRRPETVAVHQVDRSLFKDICVPPPGWRVWIGHYAPNAGSSYWVHACMPIHIEGDFILPNFKNPAAPLPTTQWSTLTVGNLFLQTVSSSTSPDLIRDWRWDNAPAARRLLVQIWPIKESLICWPPLSMSHIQAQAFSTAQFNFLRQRAQLLGRDVS
jgi:hypothetical protein